MSINMNLLNKVVSIEIIPTEEFINRLLGYPDKNNSISLGWYTSTISKIEKTLEMFGIPTTIQSPIVDSDLHVYIHCTRDIPDLLFKIIRNQYASPGDYDFKLWRISKKNSFEGGEESDTV